MNEANPGGNAVLVNALGSSMRFALNGMDNVPGLLRQVIEEGSWRSFTTPRGENVTHDTFESFITTKPSKGLGYSIEALVRLIGDDDELLGQVAELAGRTAAELRQWIDPNQQPLWRDPSDDADAVPTGTIEEPDLDLTDPVDRDAYELRTVGKSGGWVWALKVARNVQLDVDHGVVEDQKRDVLSLSRAEKVSANEFARRIGWSTPRVMRYYRAWERGIEKYGLPDFNQLQPGVDVDLPSAKTWTACFTAGRVNPDRAEALAAGAEEAGLSVREVIYAAKSPGAMKAAILADDSTAEAARTALLERARDDGELRAAMVRTIANDPVFRKETAVEGRRAERAEYVRHVADDGKVRTPGGQTLELPQEAKAEVSKLLTVVNSPHATAEDVAEVYEVVQGLTAKAIEADPEIQLREQRSKFTKALSNTSKNIQAIDPDDLLAVADDDVRAVLTELQTKVNALADLVGEL
ncbi:hypothetical protein OH807_05890 [Kitasatospora sp. NBC_01560]|uniref:hypothetical protein n=1 Tax=Kitasatospora sp. NBC_01560 TaxID=2975965 RepID=UPI00386AE4F3